MYNCIFAYHGFVYILFFFLIKMSKIMKLFIKFKSVFVIKFIIVITYFCVTVEHS